LTIGYDSIEYDPFIWNTNLNRPIICLDVIPAYQDNAFLPVTELIGDIGESLNELATEITTQIDPQFLLTAVAATKEIQATVNEGMSMNQFPVQPLRLVFELQKQMTSDTHVALDIGSNYIWLSRYLAADHPRQVLVSNGQLTLGVSIPWAIALSLLYPNDRVLSTSGDGGFLFTGSELATAVRVGAKFVHVIWDDGSYDMVAFQEQVNYGETAGVALGQYDPVKFAEAFGCKGYSVKSSADELPGVFEEAFKSDVPVLIHVRVDYSLNERLMQNVLQSYLI